jgi:predicted permease
VRHLRWLIAGVANLFRGQARDGDMHDEMAFHLDERTAHLRARGLSQAEARRMARAEFGSIQKCVEQTREAWGFRVLSDLRQDLRHAVRLFGASPGFTFIAVASLAIGIGANASIFSVADALAFRPLGIHDPSSVLAIGLTRPDERGALGGMSYPDYLDFRDRAASFDGVAAHQLFTFAFGASRDAVPDMRLGMAVSDNFFSVLGIPPLLGRAFAPGEGKVIDADAVVVLGHDFWSGSFAGDRTVVGREVWINGTPLKVIGVTPARFTGMDQYVRPAFFLPAAMLQRLTRGEDRSFTNRATRAYGVHARLSGGASVRRAQNEAVAIWEGMAPQRVDAGDRFVPEVLTEWQVRLRNSREDVILMVLLLALVGLVLAIACANVANLLLGRARARAREMAIRLALGVSRSRLVRQLLTESTLLAMAGCGAGLALATFGIRALSDIQLPTDLPIVIEPRLDSRVLLFSLAAATLSVLMFGIGPAANSVRTDLVSALKGSAPGRPRQHRVLGRRTLVVVQVALAMVLLISAGIVLKGFERLVVLDPGFRTDHVLLGSVDTALAGLTREQSDVFYRKLRDAVRKLPTVASVAMTGAVPLDPSQQEGLGVVPEGFTLPSGRKNMAVQSATVDEHYFTTMRMPIVTGRGFAESDGPRSQPVVVVNEQFARVYWPGQLPIGKRLRLDYPEPAWATVVGVAKNAKYGFIGEQLPPFLYVPFSQHPRASMSLLVESAGGDPSELAQPLREVVRDLNPNQPLYNVRTLTTFYQQRALAIPERLFHVVATMGMAGLVLAVIGLYGLVAYTVACRTREIGIRIAMGAQRRQLIAMVLREGLVLGSAGVATGAVGSFFVSRVLIGQMSGLAAPSAAAYALVPMLLVALTVIASYVPARRASLIDPLKAVRHE